MSSAIPSPRATSAVKGPGFVRWATVGVLAYAGWFVANLLLLVLFLFFYVAEAIKKTQGRTLMRIVGAFFLRFFFFTYFSLIRVYRTGERPRQDQLIRAGPRLLVANHRSWIDALLLQALVPGIRIPVNAEYLRVPLAGRAMRWMGSIAIDRRSRESIVHGVAEVRQALQYGKTVAVFPEGTRSAIGEMRPFSDLFFRLAIDENVPILPLIIHLDVPFLGPGRENLLTARCGVLTIRVLDEIRPRTGERGVDLARRVRKMMRTELQTLDRM